MADFSDFDSFIERFNSRNFQNPRSYQAVNFGGRLGIVGDINGLRQGVYSLYNKLINLKCVGASTLVSTLTAL